MVLVSRNPAEQIRIPIEYSLDLSSLSEQDSCQYDLAAIVAYNNMPRHYVIYKLNQGQWYLINDSFCYTVPYEIINCLSGGTDDECNDLWLRTNNEKWVSSLLLYVKKGSTVV